MSLDPAVGTEVAGYRIVEEAGSGGMGVVYLGRSPGGRPAAVKVIAAGRRCGCSPGWPRRWPTSTRTASATATSNPATCCSPSAHPR